MHKENAVSTPLQRRCGVLYDSDQSKKLFSSTANLCVERIIVFSGRAKNIPYSWSNTNVYHAYRRSLLKKLAKFEFTVRSNSPYRFLDSNKTSLTHYVVIPIEMFTRNRYGCWASVTACVHTNKANIRFMWTLDVYRVVGFRGGFPRKYNTCVRCTAGVRSIWITNERTQTAHDNADTRIHGIRILITGVLDFQIFRIVWTFVKMTVVVLIETIRIPFR